MNYCVLPLLTKYEYTNIYIRANNKRRSKAFCKYGQRDYGWLFNSTDRD